MEKLYELYERYRDYILSLFLLIIIISSEVFMYYKLNDVIEKNSRIKTEEKHILKDNKQEEKDKKELLYVDVKGEVLTPGVYSFEKGRVIDAVNKAGGITEKADTSINNLGKKLVDEMVIIIYSKTEVKKMMRVIEKKKKAIEKCNEITSNNSCITENDITFNENAKKISSGTNKTKSTNNNGSKNTNKSSLKISINNASKKELMTLSGIGESKAKNIIDYRNKNKFNDISEIKNVKGIGDSIFEKIKDNITI